MGKKAKRRKTKTVIGKRNKSVIKKRTLIFWLLGIVLIVIVVLLIHSNNPFSNSTDEKGKSFSVKGGETRSVLDPAIFFGITRTAYVAAKKYPEVMDQIYCYCGCDEPPFNHKSLLSCFVTNHGAG